MRKTIAAIASVLLLAACTSSSTDSASQTASGSEDRAVVIVSGGATSSPFTTPTQACSDDKGFLAAGNTDTVMRSFMLSKGKQVYTAPVMDNWGPVREPTDDRPGPFKDCPIVLPESMTILSTGDINAGGERLARFLEYLESEYGVTDIDLVGHSNGGLWSRAAIKVLKETDSPITVRSLTTIGTPHSGSIPGRYTVGEINLDACAGNSYCENALKAWIGFADKLDKGLNRENTEHFLSGPGGWNAAQGDVLDGIPVVMLAGTYFENSSGDPTVWPYDGTASRFSSWATDVPDSIIPWRACWEGPLVHTIYQTTQLQIPRDLSITDNAEAVARVNQAIDEADTSLSKPNREGCSS